VFKYNFHTHTHYCDGSSAPEEYVLAAIDSGLRSIGFSSHAPVPFENNFAIKNEESLRSYVEDIRLLKKKYRDDIDIFLALEADFIPGITKNFQDLIDDHALDYVIGSVHLVKNRNNDLWFIDGSDPRVWVRGLNNLFDGDIRKAVGDFFSQLNMMIDTQKPDVIGHMDKIKMHNRGEYFSEDVEWYIQLFKETLALIKQQDCIVEVNTRGVYKKRSESFFPGTRILKEMQKMNIPVTISADAHKPEEVSLGLDQASEALMEIGYTEAMIFSEEGWKSILLD